MGILSNDIYNDDWRVEFGMYIMGLHTDPSQERFDTINSICSKHLKRNDRRLNWKSNRYLAIAPPNDDQWKDYKGAKIIIAADEELLSGSGWRTYVYKWIGPVGHRNKRAQWYKAARSQANPILSTGYHYSNYNIYILPDDVWKLLFDMLPKKPGDFDEI